MPPKKGQKYKPRKCFAVVPVTLTCALCPRRFTRNHSQHKYCGRCRSKAAKQKVNDWHRRNDIPELRRVGYRRHYTENTAKIAAKVTAYNQTERGKEARRIASANQILRNSKKVGARQMVRAALLMGILVKQPCEVCGAPEVQAHHEDYDKPLEVNWLCVTDHKRLHKERGTWRKVTTL